MTVMNKKKICVGISGGVDSATTAHLLIQAGHEVFGATMYLFDIKDEQGNWKPPGFLEDARKACDLLGIEHVIVDLREEFRMEVIEPFKKGFLEGVTPNPCTICNRYIKYGRFMDRILELGADAMATGHYVRIEHRKDTGSHHLRKGITLRKDQSYYLHGLSEQRLSKLILPLGQYETKEAIRALASGFNQDISEKKDSLGICFTQGRSPFEYLKDQLPDNFGNGNFVLEDGSIVGSHDGYFQFTIGQKKGLPKVDGKDMSVIRINADSQDVILGDDGALYETTLIMENVNWIHRPSVFPWHGVFRICTWGYDLQGTIEPLDAKDTWQVKFDTPVRAIAKGQACVVYLEDEILGGGTIL